MRLSYWGCAVALAVGLIGLETNLAGAQPRVDEYGRPVRAPARIVVTPTRRLVRECVDWYAIENRLAGAVVTPQIRCRWGYR